MSENLLYDYSDKLANELVKVKAENARLRDVVKQIRAISCGEDQVADGDAVFALAVIFHLCRAALAEKEQS